VTVLRVLSLVLGALVVLTDLSDMVRSLVVPRPIRWRPVTLWATFVRRALYDIAVRIRPYEARDRFLAATEPVVMLFRLASWLAVGLAGFGFLVWGAGGVAFGRAFVVSGSSMFTLGFAVASHAGSEVIEFAASAFGLLVVALQIAYLPALYDSFNRRETLVTMLESRAGSPAWGPELLSRHYLVGIEGSLPGLYSEWERWCADVAESHSTYPSLLHFRSPHSTNSWVVAVMAVMDSAALYLSLCPSVAPPEARLCVRMGFTCLRDIARVMRIDFDADPLPDAPIALPFEDFALAVKTMKKAGVPVERTPEEAWPQFRGWRVNYESLGYAMAFRLFAPPALWTGPRRDRLESIAPVRPVDRRPEKPEGDEE
jgi:hypothetical protein